jgi:hypothetical protein
MQKCKTGSGDRTGMQDHREATGYEAPDYQTPWAYGKGWPWTLYSIAWDIRALPFYTLRATTPETAVSGVAARRAGGLWPSSTPLDTRRRTPLSGV